ncbi:hypothetical protein [Sporosarcina obsidiansis]|uniref:hypothetical protein n=1 Tax=Sporosarcina obsidiansis TaxID=2660748 RepID=UPI00129A243D|nr:hypothetical protein [Sporosarcina obsidiansis]
MESVWVIFSVDKEAVFPNFFPVGVYSVKEEAERQIAVLPKGHSYQLFELPIDTFFGEMAKDGRKVESGLGRLMHIHYGVNEEG